MSIFSDISNMTSDERKLEVPTPNIKLFVGGIVLLALGLLGASVCTVEDIDKTPALIFLCIGAALIIAAIITLIRYGKQAVAFKKYAPTWEKHRSMFDDFAIELNHWYDCDIHPQSCDGDTSYILRLQKDRMARKGIWMIQYTSPVKRESFGTARVPRKTAWYTVDLMYESVARHLQFQNSSGTIYERDTEDTMYETVVHTPNEQELTHMSMSCPNCGAVSLVAALTEGCPYCRTVFHINDLFPRVTNTFFIRKNSSTKNQKKIGRTTGITMLIVFLVSSIALLLDKETPIPQDLFMSYFITLILGGIFGYIISIIIFMAKQFNRDGRKSIPFRSYVTAKGKVRRAFAKYDPYFSFEKFEGQIISLVRMAIMSDHPENLASYCGETLSPYFRDIIEMTYMQAMTVQDIHMEGSHLCLTLRTWWINYSERDGRVNSRGDCIDVTLRRNTAYMEPPGFSITSVHCRNCGGSFDSVRQRNCPYCGTEYHMENEGFIIERLDLV